MRRIAAAVALTGLAAGCVPGPRPIPAAAHVDPPLSWRDQPAGTGAIDPHWWHAYGDPLLDQAVERALARNTDVLSAVANVDAARAQLRSTRAELLPSVQAIGDAQASHMGGGGGASGNGGGSSGSSGGSTGMTTRSPSVTKTFEVGGLAAWEIDLFGRVRALTRAARQQYVASQADRDAAALSVAAATVTAYLQLLATDEQVRLIRETVTARQRTVAIEQDRLQLGYDSRLPYLQAAGELQSVESQLPAELLAQRQQENALAILTGELPGAVPRIASLRRLRVPGVPATMPVALLRRRPDIAAAEWRLAASDSTIAAQRAAFLPSITLSGEYLKTFISTAGYDAATVWSVGNSLLTPLISLPLFQGGALRANFNRAVAERDLAAYAYRAAVLKAFGDVENGLTGVQRLDEQVAAVTRQVATAHQLLAVAQDRNDEGYTDYLDVLDSQRTLFAAQQALIAAESSQLANLATLATALGGGWEAAILDGSARTPSAPPFPARPVPAAPVSPDKEHPR